MPPQHPWQPAAVLALVTSVVAILPVIAPRDALAQSTPGVGWQATLSRDYHNVSGTVTVLDADTLQVDDFTFDGGGIVVKFYLGASDSSTDFYNGLGLGDDLRGMAFDGTQGSFTVDLPAGATIDGYNAVSVWCEVAGVSFGSGTFQPTTTIPEPATAALLLTGLAATAAVRRWRN